MEETTEKEKVIEIRLVDDDGNGYYFTQADLETYIRGYSRACGVVLPTEAAVIVAESVLQFINDLAEEQAVNTTTNSEED
jgi:hypothetical protein